MPELTAFGLPWMFSFYWNGRAHFVRFLLFWSTEEQSDELTNSFKNKVLFVTEAKSNSRTPLKENYRSYPKKESKISWEGLLHREIRLKKRNPKMNLSWLTRFSIFSIKNRKTLVPSKSLCDLCALSANFVVKKSCHPFGILYNTVKQNDLLSRKKLLKIS